MPKGTIVDQVKRYFYESEDIEKIFIRFAKEHCDVVDLTSDEHKHECKYLERQFDFVRVALFPGVSTERSISHAFVYDTFSDTQIYNKFQRLFDRTFADFIEDQGSTVEEFYAKLRESGDRDDDTLCQVLLAVSEYEVFMQLMRDTAKDQIGGRNDPSKYSGDDDETPPSSKIGYSASKFAEGSCVDEAFEEAEGDEV